MGAFFPIGKGSVYVACGNRMGGNELRFPRVGKSEVKSGATPPNHLRDSWRKKKGRVGVLMCVRVVGGWVLRACGGGASVDARGRARVASGFGCARSSPHGAGGGGCAQAYATSVRAAMCPGARACVRVCVRVSARSVGSVLYFYV